ncbi:MAG: hypothetical protein ACPGWR_28705 [Ardenticatenaceae bacterium]
MRAYHNVLDIWLDGEVIGHSTSRINNDYSAYVHVYYYDEEYTNDGTRSWDKLDIEEVILK